METEQQKSNIDQPVVIGSKTLRAGTVLIPKPQHKEYLEKVLLKTRHVVTKEQEEANGTIGDMWMIE